MNIDKEKILKNICYTELVYQRVNKKLKTNMSKTEIKNFIFKILKETNVNFFSKKGKNYYITNYENRVRITINSNSFRVITVDKM